MARPYSRTLADRSGVRLLFNWFMLVSCSLFVMGLLFWTVMPSSARSSTHTHHRSSRGSEEKQRSEHYSELRSADFSAYQDPPDPDLEEVERQITLIRQRSPPPRPPPRADLDMLLRTGTQSRDRSGWLWGWGETNDRGLDAALHELILRDGAEQLLTRLQGKARTLRRSLRGAASGNRTADAKSGGGASMAKDTGITPVGTSEHAHSVGASSAAAGSSQTIAAKAELKRLEGLVARLKHMLRAPPPPPHPPPPSPPPPSPPPPPRATHIPKPHQQQPARAALTLDSIGSVSSSKAPSGQGKEAAASPSPAPSGPYYQQGLISRLLRVSTRPVASPYLPTGVSYYPVLADMQALGSVLKEQGYNLPLSPYHYLVNQSRSCMEVATDVEEPFVAEMLQRNRPLPGDLPGGVPLTAWRWDKGAITREEFDAVPTQLRNSSARHLRTCAHCTSVAKFKVLNGVLMRSIDNPGNEALDSLESLLGVAVHLYDIPDVDFLVHWGDGATSDLPLLSFNIDRSQPNAGWQIPYWEHWTRHALSLAQSLVWGECVRTRYPRSRAIPRAVWRGSLSDPFVSPVTVSNLRHLARYHLHTLTDLHPDLLDARISDVTGTRDEYICPRPSSSSRLSDTAPCAQQAIQSAQLLEVILGINGTDGHEAPAPAVDPAQEYDYAAAYAAKHDAESSSSNAIADASSGAHKDASSSTKVSGRSSNPNPPQSAPVGSPSWDMGSQLPSGPWNMSEESSQHYAFLLDLDGSGWSSRFFQLAQYTAVPILRQASPLQAWYEHLLGTPGASPGAAVQQFAHNLSDVVQRTRDTLSHLGYNADEYYQQHGRRVVLPDPVPCPPAPPASPPPPHSTTTSPPSTSLPPPPASAIQEEQEDFAALVTVDGDEPHLGTKATKTPERRSSSSTGTTTTATSSSRRHRAGDSAPDSHDQHHPLVLGDSDHGSVTAASQRASRGAGSGAADHSKSNKGSSSSSQGTKHRKAHSQGKTTHSSRRDGLGSSSHQQSAHSGSKATSQTHKLSGGHRQQSDHLEHQSAGEQGQQVRKQLGDRHTGTDGVDGTTQSTGSAGGQAIPGLANTVRRVARMLLMQGEQQDSVGEEVVATTGAGVPGSLSAEDGQAKGVSTLEPVSSSTSSGGPALGPHSSGGHALLRGGADTSDSHGSITKELQQQQQQTVSPTLSSPASATFQSVASAVLRSVQEVGLRQHSSSSSQAPSDDGAEEAWRALSPEAALLNLNAAAAVLLNRWSMVEAVAYVLGKYASAIDWEPQPDERFEKVRFHRASAPWLPDKLAQQIEDATGGFYFSSRDFDMDIQHDKWDDDWDGWYHSAGYDIAKQAAAREAARMMEHAGGGNQDATKRSYGKYSGYFERGDY